MGDVFTRLAGGEPSPTPGTLGAVSPRIPSLFESGGSDTDSRPDSLDGLTGAAAGGTIAPLVTRPAATAPSAQPFVGEEGAAWIDQAGAGRVDDRRPPRSGRFSMGPASGEDEALADGGSRRRPVTGVARSEALRARGRRARAGPTEGRAGGGADRLPEKAGRQARAGRPGDGGRIMPREQQPARRVSQVDNPRTDTAGEQRPQVHISIGRIEVRAAAPAPAPQAPAQPPREAGLSLNDYLRGNDGRPR